MVAEKESYHLKVVLQLKWKQGNEYEAKVSVTTTDTCYHAGQLKIGLPPGTAGVPEIEYLTFDFTHDKGKACGEIVQTVEKTIVVLHSSAKPKVTAFAVVNDLVAGSDTKDFPRR